MGDDLLGVLRTLMFVPPPPNISSARRQPRFLVKVALSSIKMLFYLLRAVIYIKKIENGREEWMVTMQGRKAWYARKPRTGVGT